MGVIQHPGAYKLSADAGDGAKEAGGDNSPQIHIIQAQSGAALERTCFRSQRRWIM